VAGRRRPRAEEWYGLVRYFLVVGPMKHALCVSETALPENERRRCFWCLWASSKLGGRKPRLGSARVRGCCGGPARAAWSSIGSLVTMDVYVLPPPLPVPRGSSSAGSCTQSFPPCLPDNRPSAGVFFVGLMRSLPSPLLFCGERSPLRVEGQIHSPCRLTRSRPGGRTPHHPANARNSAVWRSRMPGRNSTGLVGRAVTNGCRRNGARELN